MCHHIREPTVLSRVICRPFHLNIDRFHQPCLLPGRTSRIGEDCRPRTTWRPLTFFWRAAALLFILCVSLEVFATPTRRYHDQMLIIHLSLPACATPRGKGVCTHTHTRSGPSRVRRRLSETCPWGPHPPGHLFVAVWATKCSFCASILPCLVPRGRTFF